MVDWSRYLGDLTGRQFGPFLIDIAERTLRRDGETVPLTPKAFDVLVALIEKPGQLISKEELLQKVWPDTFVERSNLSYNVFALRKALGDTAERSVYVETVPKKGYRFRARVATATPPGNAQPTSESTESPVERRSPARRVMARSRSCHLAWDLPALRSHWSRKPILIVLGSSCPRCPTPIPLGGPRPDGPGYGSLPPRFWSQQGSPLSNRGGLRRMPRRQVRFP